eukprot:365801-Chlamydomonas_euryale.AAC.5
MCSGARGGGRSSRPSASASSSSARSAKRCCGRRSARLNSGSCSIRSSWRAWRAHPGSDLPDNPRHYFRRLEGALGWQMACHLPFGDHHDDVLVLGVAAVAESVVGAEGAVAELQRAVVES